MLEQEGPIEKIIKKYYCDGCVFLKLEEWKFYGEDYEESGTDATCTKLDIYIDSYYYKEEETPECCPYVKDGDLIHKMS